MTEMRRNGLATLMALAILALAVMFFAGCQSPYGVPLTPQQQVYQMQLQLDAVLDEIDVYARQPECSEVVVTACHRPEAVAAAVQAAKEADAALDEAEAVVRLNPNADVSLYASIVRAALARIALELAAREAV